MNPAWQGQIHSQLSRGPAEDLNESQGTPNSRPSARHLHPNGYAGIMDSSSDLESSFRSNVSRRSGGQVQNRLGDITTNPSVAVPGTSQNAQHRYQNHRTSGMEEMGNSVNFQSSGEFESDEGK